MACHLHGRGDSVLGYDNFNDYYDPQLKHARRAHLSQLGIQILEGDLEDRLVLQQAIEHHQNDTHLTPGCSSRCTLFFAESPNISSV